MQVKEDQTFQVKHRYNATPDLIFNAWIRPSMIRKWLFVGPTSVIIDTNINLEINGQFSIMELDRSNGEYIDHSGEYQLIERPNRLAFTLSVSKHFDGETFVMIDIKPVNDGCELTFTQTGVSPDKTKASWEKMLDQLDRAIVNPF
jgi:uncharacterized protein YndB with AHSA1/START domain